MTTPNSSEEYQVRNILSEVVAEIPVEFDCDTLENQLCRDLYLGSVTVDFNLLAVDSIRLHLLGPLEGKEELDEEIRFETVTLKPLGTTAIGALCERYEPAKEGDDPVNYLLTGSLFTTNDPVVFENSLGVMGSEEWENIKGYVLETNIREIPILIARNCIAAGSHLAFRRAYSLREIQRFQKLSDSFDINSFTVVTGIFRDKLIRRYCPNYVLFSPAKIAAIEIATDDGEILSGEWQ